PISSMTFSGACALCQLCSGRLSSRGHSVPSSASVGEIRRYTMATHREILYVRPPEGMPDAGCFRLVEAPVPSPGDGQVLVRTHYLSIDPYMRRQMGGGHGQYANPLKPGDVMIGRGAGVVIESRHPDFKPGDAVQAEFGWREHVVLDGRG